MRVSVIISTYNAPRWLEKVLWGYTRQTHRDFEIIIADDGSTHETVDVVARMRKATDLALQHVWQKDAGFRKCRLLNKAILHARTDYLVFTDGDCIPRCDFLATHIRRARPGYFLSGSYYKLPMTTSRQIERDDILTGRCFELSWLVAHGVPRGRRNLRLIATPRQASILNRITPTRCNLKGSNASVWLTDALVVNGFDERMQWGGLDREFGVRLLNAGVRPRHVRYDAVCIHLDHARGYAQPELVAANKALRIESQRSRKVKTEHGITQLLAGGYRPINANEALGFRQANRG